MAAESVGDCLGENPALAKMSGLVDFLLSALKRRDGEVRRYVVCALGHCNDPRAFGPVLEMLKDSDAGVRSEAITAIGAIGGRRAEPILLELMRNHKAEATERADAARALGSIGDPAMVEVLIATLADASEPPILRRDAAWTLGTIRDERAVPLLLKVVKNNSEPEMVRASALQAFATIQGRRAIPVLREIISAKGYNARPANVSEAIAAWRLNRLAALLIVEVTDGAIDDVGIVTIVAREGSEPMEEASEVHLPKIAKNGQTWAVRAAARKALGTDVIIGIKERWFFLGASILYCIAAIAVWDLHYRKHLRDCQFTLGSIFVLTALIALGLPLAIAAWNAW